MHTALAICAAILLAALLYFAQSIFAPLAFAIFILAIVWPLQKKLQRRLPRSIALFLTLFATVAVIIAITSAVARAFGVVGQWLISNASRFQALYVQLGDWLEENDIFILSQFAERFDVIWLVRLFNEVAGRLNTTIGFAILAFIFLMMGLLEAGEFRQRLASLDRPARGAELVQSCMAIAAKFRKYMLVRTLLSLLTGLVIWGFASLVGLEPAAAWGVIAFALNYIPFIGPFVATLLPGLFAMAQFDSWSTVAVIFMGLMLIQFFIGNYLEPLVAGSALNISPFAVVFAVFFWSFLWGIVGALIGVPITIAILTFCEHEPSTRWAATLFLGRSAGRS